MPPRSSSSEPDTTVTVEVYPAGPPGSGEGSGVAIGFGPANFAAVGAVIEEQFGLPSHLEPLPYNRDLDGKPFWERRPGDPPLRRRYRVRPMDRQRPRRPGPRPRIRFTGPADDVRRVRSDFRRRRLAHRVRLLLPAPRARRMSRPRTAARRAAGLRSGQDPGSEEPHPEPVSRTALSSRAHALDGGHNRTRRAP